MFLEARPWLLYKLSLLGTLVEPASSSPAVFRMIATMDSKKPFNLAVTRAELKASGSIPGNLWYSEEALAGDNTGTGMLAQIINYAGISAQMINSAQDPAKYIHLVTIPTGSQKYLCGCNGYIVLASSVPSSHTGHMVWLWEVFEELLAVSHPPCSPRYTFLTSRGKQRGSKIRGLAYDKRWRLCKEYILLYKLKRTAEAIMQQGRQGLLNTAFSLQDCRGVLKKKYIIWAVPGGGSLWRWGRWYCLYMHLSCLFLGIALLLENRLVKGAVFRE